MVSLGDRSASDPVEVSHRGEAFFLQDIESLAALPIDGGDRFVLQPNGQGIDSVERLDRRVLAALSTLAPRATEQ